MVSAFLTAVARPWFRIRGQRLSRRQLEGLGRPEASSASVARSGAPCTFLHVLKATVHVLQRKLKAYLKW